MIEVRYDTKHWNAIQKIVNLPSFIFSPKNGFNDIILKSNQSRDENILLISLKYI